MIPSLLMVASIHSGEGGSYIREGVDYHGGNGQLSALEEGEPSNEGRVGSWVNLKVTFLEGIRVLCGGSLAYGPTEELGESRRGPLTKSQGQSKKSKVIKVK